MTNSVTISGRITKNIERQVGNYGEAFYTTVISCMRTSGVSDNVPVWISDYLIDPVRDCALGSFYKISGELRSTNLNGRLLLRIYAREVTPVDEIKTDINDVLLEGALNKEPVYRTTPQGRQIADISLTVNRLHGKSDYIPCIAWAQDAKFCKQLHTGDCLSIEGRLQSRDYKKTMENGITVTRTAYEVSIFELGLIYDNESTKEHNNGQSYNRT